MIYGRSKSLFIVLCFLFYVLTISPISGCNGKDNKSGPGPGLAPGSTLDPATSNPPIGSTPSTPDTPSDDGQTKVAIKYVTLMKDRRAKPWPTQEAVERLLRNTSNVWSQCKIKFVLEEFQVATASDYKVSYVPSSFYELDQMRYAFSNRKTALIVASGPWIHYSELGASNGYSTLPGSGNYPEGIILEDWVATSTLLVAHEIGHLIGGLGHTSVTTNLMNHFITSTTTKLTSS